MCARWGGVCRLQWIQAEDFISPDVRYELQARWMSSRRRRCGGRWGVLTLNSVSHSRDGRRAPPFGVDGCRDVLPSGNTLYLQLPVWTGSGLCGVGADPRLLVLRSRRRRSCVGPGQTGLLLQCEELGLPLHSTLLSVPLQRGRVTLRGWNELTTGPLCVPLWPPLVSPLCPGKRLIWISSSPSWQTHVLLACSHSSVPAVRRSSSPRWKRRLVLWRDVRSLNSVGSGRERRSWFCLYSSVFARGA